MRLSQVGGENTRGVRRLQELQRRNVKPLQWRRPRSMPSHRPKAIGVMNGSFRVATHGPTSSSRLTGDTRRAPECLGRCPSSRGVTVEVVAL
jgi:hypothetical protein